MANINKISGIGVTSILKVRGLAKAVLSKAKGRPFFSGQNDNPPVQESNGSGTSHVSAHLEENGTLFGNAAIVDGVLVSGAGGDYTRLAMTDDYRSSTNQTISFWFKSTYNPASGSWMRFVHSHIIGQGPNGFFIEMRSPTKIYFKGATQGLLADNDPTAEAPYALNDGEWHQITVSWQDSGSEALRMWVDGQPLTVLNETHVGSGTDTKPYLFIGARQFGSPMEMDKVGITEEFIDDAEALARYNSEAPAETPAGNFIESNLSPGNISSGDNILGNNTTYDETEGKLVVTGSGHTKIDVAGELTSIPFNDDGSEKVAISMWLKLDSWSGYPILFSSRNESGNNLFNMRLWRNSGFMVGSRHSKSAASTANLFTNVGSANTVNNLSDGSWHNLVYYFDGATSGEQRIYLDGSLIATRQHSDGAGQGETNYVDSAMRYFGIGDLNNASVMGGEYDSIVLYQGFEFTEAMASEVYADSTRQTIISQP